MKANSEKVFEGIEAKIDWELNRPNKKQTIIYLALIVSVMIIPFIAVWGLI